MGVIKVQHIGIVVKSIDEYLERMSVFGLKEVKPRLQGPGQISALVQLGESFYELMEPVGEEGVVPKYYAKNGEGMHHVGLLVSNMDEISQIFIDKGYTLVGKVPGDGKTRAFSRPKETGGVLYEVTEVPDMDL